MSILSLVASTPQIASLRRARDFIHECQILGLKIVPDEARVAAADKLCKCGQTVKPVEAPWATIGDHRG